MSLLFDNFVYINNVYCLLAFLCIMSIKVWVQKVSILDWIPDFAPAIKSRHQLIFGIDKIRRLGHKIFEQLS